MNFKPIFYINGVLLLILAMAMIAPMTVDLANGSPDWKVFAGSQIITTFAGFLLIFSTREKSFKMTLRETFLMTTLSFVFMAAFGALPFCLADIQMGFDKGFFEAMSGITTTGATAITGLDNLPRGILLWRSLLHWLGGIGFLIIALAVLPMLQISGMQIFKTQSFDIEKILPSASQIAMSIMLIYAGLTTLCAVLLWQAGMTFFEAVCHAMSTLSTGGFSTSDQSVGYFDSHLIEYLIIFFMILGGLPFLLYMRMGRGDLTAVFRDAQARAFLGSACVLATAVTTWLVLTSPLPLFDAVRDALFMIVSLVTTTGFATHDYTDWGPFPIAVAFLATFMGACSGSTSGGIKTFRWQILWQMLKVQLRRLITPSGVFQVRYNGKLVDLTVQNAVGLFFFVYVAAFLAGGTSLMLTGMDFISAFSGSLTAISNVGPGLGDMIGPAGNFTTLKPVQAWTLSFLMLLGRVEILTVLVLFTPGFWKK